MRADEEGPLAVSINKRKALEQASKYAQKGQLDKALKEYQKVLQADPHDTQVRLRIGDLYLRKGEPARAVQAYTQVASNLAEKGFEAKAVAIYKQILTVDRDQVETRVALGDLYQRLGLVPDALRELQLAAETYRSRGAKRQAFDLLRRIGSLNPENVANRLGLADLLMREEMEEEAEEEYRSLLRDVDVQERAEDVARVAEQMLRHLPDDDDALRAFAAAKMQTGEAAEVVDRLCKAVSRRPEEIELRELLARAYEAAGDEASARDLYAEMAEIYKQRGDAERARDLLQRTGSVAPLAEGDTSPSLVLDDAVGSDDAGGAIEFGEGLGLGSEDDDRTNVEDLLAEAKVALEFGDAQGAEQRANSILEKHSVSDGARAILAQIRAKEGNLDEAIRLTEERRTLAASMAAGDLLSEIEAALRNYVAQRDGSGTAEPDDDVDELLEDVVEEVDEPDLAARELEPGPEAGWEPAPEPPEESEIDGIELDLDEDPESEAKSIGAPEVASSPEDGREALSGIEVEIVDPDETASQHMASRADTTEETAAADEMEEAESFLALGMLDEAERVLRRILKRVPRHPQALVRLGEIAASREQAPEATGAASPGFESALPDETTEPEEEPGPRERSDRQEESDEDLLEGLDDDSLDDVSVLDTDDDEDSGDRSPQEEVIEAGPEDENPFDLARELETSMTDGDASKRSLLEASGDPDPTDFSAIFEAAKAGIEAQVGREEYGTRYDLGIGYREMGLFEDAVREFELASRGGERQIEALSSLAACKIELGKPKEAIRHLKDALSLGKGKKDVTPALRYELADALVHVGETRLALKQFKRVHKESPGFRDVEDRISELKS